MIPSRIVGPSILADGRCEFLFWAPYARKPHLRILSGAGRIVPLEPLGRGYWRAAVDDVPPGTRYFFQFDADRERPDPASHHQPLGVHGPSQVVDHNAFRWTDARWKGLPLAKMLMYELHVGTFTPEGTFDAVIPRLSALRDLGINAIELMPVAQFPGDRNWGYDGVYPYAVQDSYGGPDGLKRLVDAAHREGMAVILDVVYNHLGPEGNYFADFGPYFTDRYKTPWGKAINFDGEESDEVRNYFTRNALHWFERYHVDALRVDAVHAITDVGAKPFLAGLCTAVGSLSKKTGRRRLMIAESDLNDTKTVRSIRAGGHGFDAQWLDDFHHCVHTLLTGEKDGYYADYGGIDHLAKCLREGFVYSGQYSPARKRSHGNPSSRIARDKFVVFTNNHDQIGNRMRGERMIALVPYEGVKLHLAVTLLSPFIPMIFMGEEYGETRPFRYFVSHSDEALIAFVRNGRREEFSRFDWEGEPPDPQDPAEFAASKLRWEDRGKGRHPVTSKYFKALTSLRGEFGAPGSAPRKRFAVTVDAATRVLAMRRPAGRGSALLLFNFNDAPSVAHTGIASGRWRKVLDSADPRWDGPGPPLPAVIGQGSTINMQPQSAAAYIRQPGGMS